MIISQLKPTIRGLRNGALGQSLTEFSAILAVAMMLALGCRHIIGHYANVVFSKVAASMR